MPTRASNRGVRPSRTPESSSPRRLPAAPLPAGRTAPSSARWGPDRSIGGRHRRRRAWRDRRAVGCRYRQPGVAHERLTTTPEGTSSTGDGLPRRPDSETGKPFPPHAPGYTGNDKHPEADPLRDMALSRKPKPPAGMVEGHLEGGARQGGVLLRVPGCRHGCPVTAERLRAERVQAVANLADHHHWAHT